MKGFTTLFSLLILTVITTSAFAQNEAKERSPEDWAEMRTNLMKENLDLSETQLEKIQELNLDFAQKSHAIRNDDSIDRSKLKGMLNDLKEEHEEIIKQNLTEIQYEQWVVVRRDKLRERFRQNKQAEKAKG
jgi:Spy/CpxP family protein refolding chaperone